MKIFQDFFERFKAKDRNQAPSTTFTNHPPTDYYKIVHQSLILPSLPAPLHYFNFFSLIGQPNIPILRSPHAIHTSALDTAVTLSTVSNRLREPWHSYSIQQECEFTVAQFHFAQRETVKGNFPHLRIQREHQELSFDFKVTVQPIQTHLTQVPLGLVEYWSAPCQCHGVLQYQNQSYEIDAYGCFDYARSMNFPYLPFAFFTHQVIQLSVNQQIILIHMRDQLNRILQSRAFIRDLDKCSTQILEDSLIFKVLRVYPKVQGADGQMMYLAREFQWCYQDQHHNLLIEGYSRGDYKFGLAAGYVGSFFYKVRYNQHHFEGESAYCAYIDCRPLRWQEDDESEKGQKYGLITQKTALKP